MTEEHVIEMTRNLIEEDARITTQMMETHLGIDSAAVHTILHDHLKVRKLCARWIPHILTNAQKDARVEFCQFLIHRTGMRTPIISDAVRSLQGDETFFYHFDVETKRSSAQWVPKGGDRPVKARRSRSQGKRMFAAFFDSQGVIANIKLEGQATVTARWYIKICLPEVIESIKRRRPRSGLRGLKLHHDNAPAHAAILTREFLHEKSLPTLPHPPYSPDLSPCDFWLLPKLKEQLKGRRFNSDEEIEEAVGAAIQTIPQ